MKALTPDEYDTAQAKLGRPVTSPLIGEATSSKRARDAELSRLMDGREREKVERVSIQSPWTGRIYVVKR